MNPTRLVEFFSEVVMLVLGLLLAILALSGRFTVPAGVRLWLALGLVLVFWGGRTWLRTNRYAKPAARLMRWVRGGSLVVAGAMMIAMIWMPLGRARPMLAAVGAILAARGLLGAAVAAREAAR
jgi:hypothetical protein